jgi:hypothetical protein
VNARNIRKTENTFLEIVALSDAKFYVENRNITNYEISILYLLIQDKLGCLKMQMSNEPYQPIVLTLEKLCSDWDIPEISSKRTKPIKLAQLRV